MTEAPYPEHIPVYREHEEVAERLAVIDAQMVTRAEEAHHSIDMDRHTAWYILCGRKAALSLLLKRDMTRTNEELRYRCGEQNVLSVKEIMAALRKGQQIEVEWLGTKP